MRKLQGLSLQKLAEAAGGIVTRQALYKYEHGLDVPRSEVLLALAKAMGVSLDSFFRPIANSVSLGELACRKRSRLGKRKMAEIRSQVQDRIERWLELESCFPAARFFSFISSPEKLRPVHTFEDIESLAKKVRMELNLGLIPIENLTELLEDHGVKVVTWQGDDKNFDGFACWADDRIPVIVVKACLPGDRQRSNLAHELGHLIMKPGKDLTAEKAALRFSGAFLVPDVIARRELGDHRHRLELSELLTLKMKYGMSIQQWIYRAKDLGIINARYAAEFHRLFRAKGWHLQEPGEQLPEEASNRLKRLALQAVAEDLVSPARAAELSGIPVAELREGIQN
jgi:Zn-dependent peptidase ImmA (M78 family)/DNA-binding XRE family transcriptional regulator